MLLRRHKQKKGQTALEYMMMLMVVIIPLAVALRGLMEDSGDGKNDNQVRRLVGDAYGDNDNMGAIGRPYP